jgi:hypothetical protein
MSIIQGLIASLSNAATPAALGTRILELDAYTYSGSGNWLDLSGVGGDMVFGNTVSYSSGDHSFDFTGTGFGYVNNSVYAGLTTLTAAIWINLDSTSWTSDHTLIGGNTWALRMDATNTLNLVKYSQSDQIVTVPTFSTGTWYHIVGAMDTTETRYYVNGVKVATYTNSQVVNVPDSNISIGSNNNLNAKVRKAQIYNFALSDTAVAGLYNSECQDFGLGLVAKPASVVPTSTYAYFDPLTYSGTGNLPDLSAHNRDMVLSNGGGSISYSTRNRGTLISSGANSADLFRTPIDLRTTDCTVMVASRYNPGATNNQRILSCDNNWLLGHWGGTPGKFFNNSNWVNTTGAFGDTYDTKWRIYTGYCGVSTNLFKFYANAVQAGEYPYSGQGPQGLALFGNSGPYVSEYSAGTAGVVIVWDRLLSDAEITEAYEYFRCRYGI